jgi:hypothetical protein
MNMRTVFATPERETEEKLLEQIKLFTETDVFREFSNAVQSMFMILNSKWQLVFINRPLLGLLGLTDCGDIFGARVGEVLKCVHSGKLSPCCGTTEFCSKCGFVKAILKAFDGMQATEECRIRTRNNKALDFRVLATPYGVKSECFTILSMLDISAEKKRESLEKIFFHDVLNSAGGISSLSESILDESLQEEDLDVIRLINTESNKLIQEIQYQKGMKNAEFGDLKVSLTKNNVKTILEGMINIYRNNEVAIGKHIKFDGLIPNIDFVTDVVLLRRIIGNMLKNALEATDAGETVTVACVDEKDAVLLVVHNISFMERDVQLQVFQRSFSTKGTGRGLGTYSMKLLGENYLKGKVWFESTKEKGTTFFFNIPGKIN